MHGRKSYGVILGALLSVLLVGCQGEQKAGPRLDDARFIEVVSQLRRAARENKSSSAAFETKKAEILKQAGVTDSALFAYARSRAQDVSRLADVWDSIDHRLEPAPDSAR